MLTALEIDGYRPFRNSRLELRPLNVLVGANASGKSSLFEFLRFLSDGMRDEIPPEIVRGPAGRSLFHVPGPERFSWSLELVEPSALIYSGTILGPVGRPRAIDETVRQPGISTFHTSLETVEDDGKQRKVKLVEAGIEPGSEGWMDLISARSQRLALGLVHNQEYSGLYELRRRIEAWRFFDAARVAMDKIRQPVLVEQDVSLAQDCGNLSAVLHSLALEHQDEFEKIQIHLRAVVPGFRSLAVKSRGGPGQVLTFWKEDGSKDELSLADVSDGSLRLLCWLALAFHPNSPPLVAIDEPELGLHPRALATLASLFVDMATRTQVILATHSSTFLSQFSLDDLVVARREKGSTVFRRAASSNLLRELLQDFEDQGERAAELESLHRTDELLLFA